MKTLKKIMAGLLFAALAGAIFYGTVWGFENGWSFKKAITASGESPTAGGATPVVRTPSNKTKTELNKTDAIRFTDKASVQLLEDIDIESIVNKVLPSIVSVQCTVRTENIFGQYSTGDVEGSGIYLECKDANLYLVTNAHVVEGATSIKVTFSDGESYDAVLKNEDSLYDLAILTVKKSQLKSSTLQTITPATLAESKEVHVGEMSIAVGNALGYGTSVTVGYIGALNHHYSSDMKKVSLIQTDAAINPGNSGGALVNIDGEVIGINSSKLASTEVEGMGFAIPVTVAIPLIRELEKKDLVAAGEEGYLGIYISEITDEEIKLFGWVNGVYVKDIVENGAAAESQLLAGDIITAVNDVPVMSTEQLQSRITSYRYGTTVILTVQRFNNGVFEELQIPVKLKEKSF